MVTAIWHEWGPDPTEEELKQATERNLKIPVIIKFKNGGVKEVRY